MSGAGFDNFGDFSSLVPTSSGPSFNLGSGLSGLGGIIGGITNFAGSQAMSQGYQQEAQAFGEEAQLYGTAAQQAQANEGIEKHATQLQEMQMKREVEATLGSQIAEEGGAGLVAGAGSGMYLYRSSAQQGALAEGMIATQGELNEAQFAQEKLGLLAEKQGALAAQAGAEAAASAASSSGIGGLLGGLFQGASGIAGFFGGL